MLRVLVFVENVAQPSEVEALAIKRAEAACARFPEQVEISVLDLESDEALLVGAGVGPTIIVGDTAIAVGTPPLAGQIKRFLEAALEEAG